jgi:2Fe-2S ferredoxin
MAKIRFHQADGTTVAIEAADGISVMRAATSAGIAGILGECGGNLICATCHVYVDDAYLDGLPPISAAEEEMLDCTAEPRDDRRSRLSCQLEAGSAFDEIHVTVPAQA